MRLYYFDSISPQKACAVARHVNAPLDYHFVDLGRGEHMTPEYRAINPNMKVPALTDGDFNLWEANAIMCYLADKAGSALWPHDGRQIEIIRWLSWDADHFTRAAGTLYFEHVIKSRFGLGDPDASEIEQALGAFRKFAGVLSGHLKGRQWLVGDAPTVADFAVAVTLPHADASGIPLAEFPEVRRWHDRLNALEAWREPFPVRERQAA
jgi:glutathione S-transferase